MRHLLSHNGKYSNIVVAKGRLIMRIYIVQQGDTLWKIARQHNVNFEQLKQMNNHLANPDFIMPGMEIFLPEGDFKGMGEIGGQHQKALPKTMPAPTPMPAPQAPIQQAPIQQAPMPQIPQIPQMPPMPQMMDQMMMPWCMSCPVVIQVPCMMPPMHHMPMHHMPMQHMHHMPMHHMPMQQNACWPPANTSYESPNAETKEYYEQIRALEQQCMPMQPHMQTPYW